MTSKTKFTYIIAVPRNLVNKINFLKNIQILNLTVVEIYYTDHTYLL